MILAAAVHTAGINWESISVTFGGFVTIAGAMLGWQEHRQQATRNQISDAVNNLSEVLMAKLETKDAVNQISIRLARVEGVLEAKNDSKQP
jgi:hypothetical protein